MSVLNFPEELQVLVVDTSTELYLGSASFGSSQEAGHAIVHLYKHGAHAGTEQFNLKLYTTEDLSDTPITSDTISLSDITSLTSSNWIGRVRFDFNRENISTVSTYYVTLNPVTYTRNSDTFYIAAVMDWPYEVNTNSTNFAAAKMEFWGYR